MEPDAYPVAQRVAPLVHEHFARHLREAQKRGETYLASLPPIGAIEAIVGAAFWASLRREEGYIPKISMAYLTPAESSHPIVFERPLPLEPGRLARVGPAVEGAGIHLGVSWDSGAPMVWGMTRIIPRLCFVIEVAAPGLLVIKHHRGEESGKFVNVVVLEGDQIKLVDEQASSLPDCPALLTSLLGFDSPASWVDSVNLLVQLAVSMRAHRRGGALLIVPPGNESWQESIVRPISYALVPPFTELALLSRDSSDERRRGSWQSALGRVVNAIAGLTAIDGATIMNSEYEVRAFGAKIARRKGQPQVEHVTVTEPIAGGVAAVVDPTQLGGTRHLSAAQFVSDQHESIALVASQDGRFTIFAWSPCEDMVHAHRVETLLF